MEEQQLTFDHELERKAPEEEGAFLRKKVCVSCGRKMEADEFRSTVINAAEEVKCYWCRRLRMPSNFERDK
jgi:hypothetical protein